jgi:hypothetical protein
MNAQYKTILLTLLTLSMLTIAVVELSGVSRTAIFNKFKGEDDHPAHEKVIIPDIPKTTIAFDHTEYDFGTITEGDKVTHTYTFTNTGKHPLVIVKTKASCGCTVPSFSKEPVLPGEKGSISVLFNSTKRVGHQQKSVMIYSNAQSEAISVSFKAHVVSGEKTKSSSSL